MKLFLAFCLLAAALVLPAAAQTENNPADRENSAARPPAAATAAEPMGEDERIPFMEEQERAAGGKSRGASAPGAGGLIVRTLGALCLVGGLIFAAAWGLKKFGGFGFAKAADADGAGAVQLSVLSTVTLGTNRTLSVVRFGGQTLLVGSTGQTISLLATQDPEGENASSSPMSSTPRAPRSVAEMLAEDDEEFSPEDESGDRASFGDALADAEEILSAGVRAAGGRRS